MKKRRAIFVWGIIMSVFLVGCTDKNNEVDSESSIIESTKSSVSSSKIVESTNSSSVNKVEVLSAVGNELSGSWQVESSGSGPYSSIIQVSLTNNSDKPVSVDSSNLMLVYNDKDFGDDTEHSSYSEVRTIQPNERTTFSKIFEHFLDARAVFGFSIKYGNYSVYNEAAKEAQNENTLSSESENESSSESSQDTTIKTDIYNQLTEAKTAAIANQNKVKQEGGDPNGVQSTLASVISKSTMLKMQYSEYSDFIDQTVKNMGY